ncbi:uncharacterized protein MELLADRAFT_68217 [Melampsora larici-populina 98AG31]|uniref:Uncharacterized protein n=1 Tax=Melampsora larici-populina (strain 98AG31 / pathotype 3-4-7) TaxID=747676 RepID=F4S604_MELLP|nr:uncharacterized protein MELLADRAFT_68217 [Melampsora larici-populina 98AG31]EGF99850.1 hypothetical protein MELLADRAFT_68217 [Melampsora larici-populina 98AG31]
MRQRSSSSSKARSLLRAPSRSLAPGNSPRKRRGSSNVPDVYTEPDPLMITSTSNYPPSTLRPTASSSDLPQITSTVENSNWISQRCVILGTNDKPQDFVATGTVSYFPEKESVPELEDINDPNQNLDRFDSSKTGSSLHSVQTDQQSPSKSRSVEDDNSKFTIMKAKCVEFISTTARRVQIKDTFASSEHIFPRQNQSTTEVGCKNIELNSSRGSKSENKQSWTKMLKKRTHNLVGKNDVSKNEHESIDEECTRNNQKILKRSKRIETPCEPEEIQDPLAQFKIAVMQFGIENTRPKLISLEEAQRNDERRKEEFSKSRCSTSRALTRPEDMDHSLHQKSVSLNKSESEILPTDDDFDHQKTGALKSCNELIAPSEAQHHRDQESQGEPKDAGVRLPTVTKRHASGSVITEIQTLKRRRSNIQAHAHVQEIPYRRKHTYFEI